jgi:hypothetical protein
VVPQFEPASSPLFLPAVFFSAKLNRKNVSGMDTPMCV